MKKIIGFFSMAVLGGIVALSINQLFVKKTSPSNFEEMQNKNAKFASLLSLSESIGTVGFDFVKVSEVSTPTVVHIKSHFSETASTTNKSRGGIDPFEFFRDHGFDFDMPRGPGMATGSGVIISQDGYIVTNNHVIDNASKIEVTLNDKRTFIADLIGTDKTTDLALLKVDSKNLNFMSFGNSDETKVGQWVVAVGNPMNLTSTVTAGIISAKGRSIDLLRTQDNQYAIENFIQTDAAINPGNSGGALVNTSGQLIGINTAIASQTGSYTGYGFAIPVNLVKKVMDDLLKFGKVQRGLLGVSIQEITQELAEKEGLKELNGVLVQDVSENGAALKAGVKKGDVIIKVNNNNVNTVSGLQEEIGRFRPGDKVNLTINRKGEIKNLTATLKGMDGKETVSIADKSELNTFKGLSFGTLSKEEKEKLGLKNGVKVENIGNGPFKGKIPKGFVITKIDKQTVNSPQQLKSLLEKVDGAILIEGKNEDGTENVIGLKIEK
jgi:serine protease Do